MIKTEKIKIKITSKRFKYFKDKGYDVIMNQEIDVYVKDLPKCSKVKITFICDNCGIEKTVRYDDYNRHSKKFGEYYCNKCLKAAIINGCQNKYKVDNVFQLEEIKEKSKKN
jgi:late competence protein required for DNA uptake (superfamily II DNA/RNA helicase)